MAKTIAVLGITGNQVCLSSFPCHSPNHQTKLTLTQGGFVADKFLSLGWNVRGITRSTSSSSAAALKAKGITLIEADLDNPSTLIPAFSGAHVIFAVTDFWAPYFASYEELSKVSDRETGEYAFEIEVRRGKGIVDAVEKVLKDEGMLKRFIFSTLPSLKKVSGGKYAFNYHFDGKAEISGYLKGKKELWGKSSLLNMGFYTTNLVKMGPRVGFGKVSLL